MKTKLLPIINININNMVIELNTAEQQRNYCDHNDKNKSLRKNAQY